MRLQEGLAGSLAAEVGIAFETIGWTAPPVGTQLALGGYLSMVDWIASSEEFPGTGDEIVTLAKARDRAAAAWTRLGLGGAWESSDLLAGPEGFQDRFGYCPYPSQRAAMQGALDMSAPGLLLIEAPMGEGKTEAGLAAAEILARRFGLNGVAFAMPTQGTTDAMYARCTRWMASVNPQVPVSLHHGKAMLNESWRTLLEGVRVFEVGQDEYGLKDPYGCPASAANHSDAPSRWLLGRHRGLLSSVAVATVDQVLYAATRTKFVQLRHAGLAGKVLLIDEVHSYDVYMGTFLRRLLEWCRSGAVPVVLMSATLPPHLRDEILAAAAGVAVEATAQGYPRITRVEPDCPDAHVYTVPASRAALPVTVRTVLDSPSGQEALKDIAQSAAELTADGGVALVVLDTVDRAQQVYAHLQVAGVPARLLHGRLTTRERADRTAELVDALGPHRHRGAGRPDRLVVVATQIAEQSFDVDVDVLISDIAPVDLLLQRMGRLFRHRRPLQDRPGNVSEPQVIVTGYRLEAAGPVFAAGIDHVYDPAVLTRTAMLLEQRQRDGLVWMIPDSIPTLVQQGYDPHCEPSQGWRDGLAVHDREAASRQQKRQETASTYALTDPAGLADLTGLHRRTPQTDPEDEAATVRDGELSVDVVLVRRTEEGFQTLRGRPLGACGEVATSLVDVAREVLGDTVRIPRRYHWVTDLRGLPAWRDDPLLGYQVALELDEEGHARFGADSVRYDRDVGLRIESVHAHPRQS